MNDDLRIISSVVFVFERNRVCDDKDADSPAAEEVSGVAQHSVSEKCIIHTMVFQMFQHIIGLKFKNSCIFYHEVCNL